MAGQGDVEIKMHHTLSSPLKIGDDKYKNMVTQ
jgi:hypothetical protein